MINQTPGDELSDAGLLYGQWSDGATLAAARQLSEVARFLSHATRTPAAITNPRTAAAVLSALASTLHRLPQLTLQLGQHQEILAGHPRITADGTDPLITDPTQITALITANLDAAGPLLEELVGILATAARHADRLYFADEPTTLPLG